MFNCPKCSSNNVNIQMLNETHLKRRHRSLISWLLFWWWIELLLWIILTIPRLLIALFMPKRHKTVTVTKKIAVCQNCGNSWKI
jgi:hypothetical protein